MGVRLHVANLVSGLLPQTRSFSARRRLYSWAGVLLGQNVRLNGGVVIQNANVAIGQDTWVGRRTEFVAAASARIVIGERCDVSQDVLFITGTHDIGGPQRRAGAGRSEAIAVGDGSWIGARVTFMGGSSVGRGAVVGAGSIVMSSFPDNVLIVGTPARVVREL